MSISIRKNKPATKSMKWLLLSLMVIFPLIVANVSFAKQSDDDGWEECVKDPSSCGMTREQLDVYLKCDRGDEQACEKTEEIDKQLEQQDIQYCIDHPKDCDLGAKEVRILKNCQRYAMQCKKLKKELFEGDGDDYKMP